MIPLQFEALRWVALVAAVAYPFVVLLLLWQVHHGVRRLDRRLDAIADRLDAPDPTDRRDG